MKRIVICADGTWNEPEQKDPETGKRKPTNVLKVARAVLPVAADGTPQVVEYLVGIGTDDGLDKWTGGAFGHGMEKNVRTLYRFLVFNYMPGDEIYLFGFSRGAFTVRTLAGFMNAVGLLQKEDEYYTPELYGLYESSTPRGSAAWQHAFRKVEDRRPCPPIRFVGVWDTVGALGAPGALGQIFNRNKYKYHDIGLHDQIENAGHALAIDEQRKPFAPSLYTRPAGWKGKLEQAWFPGYHSNVGGSCHPDGMANEALHWIVGQAEALGLEFDAPFLANYWPCFNAQLHDSMTLLYKVMGRNVRPIGRQAADGEAIHQATLDRRNFPECAYDPENLRDGAAGALPTVDTKRIARGKPCPPMAR